MSKLVKQGTTDIQVVQNTDVGGIYFHANTHQSANGVDGTMKLDWKGVQITCTLHRGGNSYTIVSGNAKALLSQAYFSDTRFATLQNVTAVSLDTSAPGQCPKIVQHTGSVKQQRLYPATLDFNGTLNLRNSDRLELEVTWNSGTNDALLETSLSNLICGFTTGVGLETVTPVIKVYAISGEQREFNQNIGSGVSQITYCDFATTSNLTSAAALSRVRLSSDKLNFQKQRPELICERLGQFEGGFDRLGTYELYDGFGLDSVNLDITHDDTTKVTAGDMYVVVRSSFAHPKAVAFAIKKTAKHQRKAIAKARGVLRRGGSRGSRR